MITTTHILRRCISFWAVDYVCDAYYSQIRVVTINRAISDKMLNSGGIWLVVLSTVWSFETKWRVCLFSFYSGDCKKKWCFEVRNSVPPCVGHGSQGWLYRTTLVRERLKHSRSETPCQKRLSSYRLTLHKVGSDSGACLLTEQWLNLTLWLNRSTASNGTYW